MLALFSFVNWVFEKDFQEADGTYYKRNIEGKARVKPRIQQIKESTAKEINYENYGYNNIMEYLQALCIFMQYARFCAP